MYILSLSLSSLCYVFLNITIIIIIVIINIISSIMSISLLLSAYLGVVRLFKVMQVFFFLKLYRY